MVDPLENTTIFEILTLAELERVVDGAAGHAAAADRLHGFRLGALHGPGLEHGVDFFLMSKAVTGGLKALVANEVCAADDFQQSVPLPVIGAVHIDIDVVIGATGLTRE